MTSVALFKLTVCQAFPDEKEHLFCKPHLFLLLSGAYKTHLFSLNVDLGPQDPIPEVLDKFVNVEYSMANSTVSRTQVRSISVSGMAAEDPPDRWVHHVARYEYTIEIEFTDRVRCKPTPDDIEDQDFVLVSAGNLFGIGGGEGSQTASPAKASGDERPKPSDDDSSSADDSD